MLAGKVIACVIQMTPPDAIGVMSARAWRAQLKYVQVCILSCPLDNHCTRVSNPTLPRPRNNQNSKPYGQYCLSVRRSLTSVFHSLLCETVRLIEEVYMETQRRVPRMLR